MNPVIRVDEEVWKQLQERARPLIDTPNDVLRQILKLDSFNASDNVKINKMSMEVANKVKDSIFIVINAAGEKPNEENARNGARLTNQRINSGIDILAPRRFSNMKRLKSGARIVMHRGGAKKFRIKYGSGQLISAGRVKGTARASTEKDKLAYAEDYNLTQECYPGWQLVGIIFYEFPKGLAEKPLPKESVPYKPGRGNNVIEIKLGDPRYAILDEWWTANY